MSAYFSDYYFQQSFDRAQRQYDNQLPPADHRDGMDEPAIAEHFPDEDLNEEYYE